MLPLVIGGRGGPFLPLGFLDGGLETFLAAAVVG
jgi:hypothetical protein